MINKSYSNVINNNPLLTKKEEISLSRLAKKGDKKARKKLIESNYRLVISIAKKYHRNNISFDDLIQESSIGLLKAVDKYDPELGYKFSTYATWWIKQAALQFINESATDIKVPVHSRLLNSKIQKAISKFELDNNKKPSYKEIAESIDESVSKVRYTIKANSRLASLDKEDKDTSFSLKNSFKDESLYTNPEQNMLTKEMDEIIRNSLKSLTQKEEKIIRLRFGITEDPYNTDQFPLTQEMKSYIYEK